MEKAGGFALAPQTMPRLFTSGIVGAVEPELHRVVSDCLEQGDGRSDRAIITLAPHRALIRIKVPCSIGKTEGAASRGVLGKATEDDDCKERQNKHRD